MTVDSGYKDIDFLQQHLWSEAILTCANQTCELALIHVATARITYTVVNQVTQLSSAGLSSRHDQR